MFIQAYRTEQNRTSADVAKHAVSVFREVKGLKYFQFMFQFNIPV